MPSCAVITCRARSQINKGVSFHRFPKEPDLREQWIDVTGRDEWVPTKSSTICSKHFREDCFFKKSGRKFLLMGAIPSVKIAKSYSLPNEQTIAESTAVGYPLHIKVNTITQSAVDGSPVHIQKETDTQSTVDVSPVHIKEETIPESIAGGSPMHIKVEPITESTEDRSLVHIKLESITESTADGSPVHIKKETVTESTADGSSVHIKVETINESTADGSPVHINEESITESTAVSTPMHITEQTVTESIADRSLENVKVPEFYGILVIKEPIITIPSAPSCFMNTKQISDESPGSNDSLNKDLKQIIASKDIIIKQQQRKIKQIQAQNRRLKKKLIKMEDIIILAVDKKKHLIYQDT